MRHRSMNFRPLRSAASGLVVTLSVILSGCAAGPQNAPQAPQAAAGEEEFNDPFEDTNRAIFEFNRALDRNVLVPVAKAYRTVVPDPVRDSLRDFLANLRGPVIFANDTLQGEFGRAGDTLARFAINSTIGIGGIVDLAGRWGIPYHDQDFGLTLAVWGIPEGPYLVVPALGPSNPRDLGGQVGEGFADPWNVIASNNNKIWIPFIRGAVGGIDERSRYIETLADIERTSLDYYATIRSLYRQRRETLIRHQQENLPPNPGMALDAPGFGPRFDPSSAHPTSRSSLAARAVSVLEVSP